MHQPDDGRRFFQTGGSGSDHSDHSERNQEKSTESSAGSQKSFREIILDDIYPVAIRSGMTKKDFLHSTMKDVNIRIEEYGKEKEEKIKTVEYLSWLTGIYVTHSIAVSFNKHAKYPDSPIKVDPKDTKKMAKVTGKSEEELRQEEMYMSLLVRQANANIAKAREEREALKQEGQAS